MKPETDLARTAWNTSIATRPSHDRPPYPKAGIEPAPAVPTASGVKAKSKVTCEIVLMTEASHFQTAKIYHDIPKRRTCQKKKHISSRNHGSQQNTTQQKSRESPAQLVPENSITL